MSAVIEKKEVVQGGAFLIEDHTPDEIFTPEDFTEEHRMIAETTRQFVDNEVVTRIDELEKHDWKLSRELVGKAADLGLIGANIPEEYGGLGLDQTSGALIGENIGRSASFATTLGAESGIGLLPIVYFATDAAKQKYLPKIASGELITAYALTEAGSGSDDGRESDGAFERRRQGIHSQRREDVDHERRLCRHLHRVCESRRRQVQRFHRRA